MVLNNIIGANMNNKSRGKRSDNKIEDGLYCTISEIKYLSVMLKEMAMKLGENNPQIRQFKQVLDCFYDVSEDGL